MSAATGAAGAAGAAGGRIVQVCADRGVGPGGTKGAAQHLRGIAAGFQHAGCEVVTHAARRVEGAFPAPVRPLDELGHLAPGAFDLVYERYSLGHLDGLRLARRLGVPFVLEVNAPLADEARRYRDGASSDDRAVEDALLGAADLVITVASELTDWVRTRRDGPVVTLPNGFEPQWFASDPAGRRSSRHDATGRDPDASGPVDADRASTLVFLGHPKPWHGADRLVPLLVELARTGHRPDLLVVGGGPGADELVAAAERAGVGDRVTVTGALPPAEATRRLAHGAIGLAPYRRLSPFYFCPLKVVDYLAAGLAVVSTAQGDIPTLVGAAGVLVDPDDDAAFADGVRGLLDDPVGRAAMAAEGRRRAHATMTWDQVAARTLDAVDELDPVWRRRADDGGDGPRPNRPTPALAGYCGRGVGG